MSKFLVRVISVITLGWIGISDSKPLDSNQFESIQDAEINKQLKANKNGRSLFPGQCDDAVEGPKLLTDDLDS